MLVEQTSPCGFLFPLIFPRLLPAQQPHQPTRAALCALPNSIAQIMATQASDRGPAAFVWVDCEVRRCVQ